MLEAHIKAHTYAEHNIAYLNGMYVYQALISVASTFGKKSEIVNYPRRPFIYEMEEKRKFENMSLEDKDKIFRDTLNEWL